VASSAPSTGRLAFDKFEVDLRSGEIWKNGKRLRRLQEQPFLVLQMLLERRGELVTREELQQRLWPADTFVDFDDGLNTAVRKIRDRLGDSPDRPRYIETIPRRGYRFVATVQASSGAGNSTGPAAGASPVSRKLLALAALLIVAGLAFWLWRLRAPQPEPASVRAIAVLPLENLSGDFSQDYFAAGLTDALTTELARTVGGSMRVTSRTSADKYRGKPLVQIARELNVDAVIEGSVVKSGNRVRITAQLIHARADKHLWAASYERDLQDVLHLQREIAATVARQVQIRLTPQAQARLASAAVVNPEAYDSYQRGRYLAFSNNRQDMATAIELLERAVQLDPNLASAHALLARLYRNQAFFFQPANRDLRTRADMALSRALTLDPDLADAYLVRGSLAWTHENGFPHEQVIREQQRAVELDPNLAEAHHELGKVFMHIGLFEKAGQHLQAALQLDPTNIGVRYRIAVTLLNEGRLQEAVAGLEGTHGFAPELWTYQMSMALFQLGRKEEAAALIRDYLRDNPRDEGGVGNAMQALLYADAGQTTRAERSIEAAIRKGQDFGHFHHAAYTIGSAYALMDKPQAALRWLRAAAADGFPCYPLFARDPSLDRIRTDPAFRQFMADLKRSWEHIRRLS
jgi:TolB-like protein/DNA-binding winged helix-turn-helix (wHTH) protein